MSTTDFKPIHNPYIVGNPIRDRRMFFGREDDFNYIRQKVTGGKQGGLLVLCGTRRSGKTSILFQIMNGRLGDEFRPVLVDMQAMTVDSDRDFLLKLAHGVTDATGLTDVDVERDFLPPGEANMLAGFERFVGVINDHLAGRKLILLFDEYEIFESHMAKSTISIDVLNLFANWIEHKEGVFIIFTGSDKLEERSADYWAHFLGKALHRRISFLSRGDTLRLILEPVKDEVVYEEGVPEEIYDLTAGQPFYTQVFCQALVDHLNEERTDTVSRPDLQAVTQQVVENPLPQMIFSWNSCTNIEKLALSLVGELTREAPRWVTPDDITALAGEERIGYRIDPGKLNETLEKLFHGDLLVKSEDGQSYGFKMDLWRRWIARMHSIWKVIDEIQESGELGEGIERMRRQPKRRTTAILSVVVLAAAVALFAILRPDPQTPAPPSLPPVELAALSIITDPPNADVFVGNRLIGRSPIASEQVPAGVTPVRIELGGYHAVVDTLDLAADSAVERSVTLEPVTGAIRVTSSPDGARVFLDRRDTGRQTPVVLEDLPVVEPHRIEIRLAGYSAGVYPGVSLFGDSTIVIDHSFSRLTSQVRIESDPPGAAIVVDGRERGKTPDIVSLSYGSHRVELRHDGFTPRSENLTVSQASQTVTWTLNRMAPGTLIIKITPYADVFIAGEKKKSETQRYETSLAPGRYTVELRHPVYEPVTVGIDIVSGQVTEKIIDVSQGGEQP